MSMTIALPVRERNSFVRFWDLFLVASFGAGIFDAAGRDPTLVTSWRGGWAAMLMLAFLVAHRWFWGHAGWRADAWPLPFTDVLLCAGIQLALLYTLLPGSPWFAVPMLAVAGQVSAGLPPRRWWLPMGGVIVFLALQIGLFDALGTGQWERALALGALIAWVVAIFLYIHLFFDQRAEREHLALEAQQAREQAQSALAQIADLERLRERERQAIRLHENMGHTLAVINVRLEIARQLYVDDPQRGADELDDVRVLARETLAELRNWPAPPVKAAAETPPADPPEMPPQGALAD